MSRSPTVSTSRGTKREMERKLSALRGQYGAHGVDAKPLEREGRGVWRLSFWLTPEREKIRLINLKLKGVSPEPELSESARAILAAIFAGAELVPFQWAGRPAWRLSTKHTRERAEDVALLKHYKLIRLSGDVYGLTTAGMQLVLRRLGGNQ